ncbi:ABC transporter ATP-binding protein [Clostridium sp. SHJSY1]|uniref:ABC transporter ATP-binding protein n=1 Tax=Clostridium sp. SHJSY1 TaxID=2942483 RepID=UPI00287549B1|nr:ABC transporter ATP-binding protein [Clostridium sp. SHJSY1]MDS0527244.1 ABC transporter ATP-binding protein [Clostridium sp. SHJSY1]
MNVLEVKGVKKKLGKREIIKGLNLSVEEGEIFGFLGPNGAGKTTTIRMLVGLIAPNEGEISICGHNVQKDKEEALRNVGAVVENPELYKYLSGRENLMQIARIRGVSKEEVQELIDLVGLKDRINDKVRKYSLGMKQRLGLAAALIGNPKLLILDEPTNGLDPTGILDFRDIVNKAAKEKGISVFISSHILSEVQNLCDKVAFINNGIIQSVEKISDNNVETELDSLTLKVSNDEGKAITLLKTLGCVKDAQIKENEIHIIIDFGSTNIVLKELISKNIEIEEIYRNRSELEQRYMELVEGGMR